ncbi:type II secretion system protein GspM [Pseudomarimonas salicorniae]|uniref:Type II secretion system protein GspM n=1 Tax=Pseudomarimonas salicorniae TaxID=2933270 RepID=A0ABT0GJ67_9GAMM|nr:type II secretion system protein GspM [Lysobacter sp. CAU 1642]MCK7594580.1 type II secretion system protein GspM [Lysobacter sp. CAU 1642]
MSGFRGNRRASRVAAVSLLALILLLGYFLGVHWWFTAPFLEARAALIEARDQELQLRTVAQLREELQRELEEVRRFEASNPEFLPEANFDLAASAIIQRLQALVDEQGAGQECTLISRSPFRSSIEEPFQRVTIKVRIRCSLDHLAPVVHGLEAGSPRLFINEFSVINRAGIYSRRPQAQTQGLIDANFDVYGFLRTAPAREGA